MEIKNNDIYIRKGADYVMFMKNKKTLVYYPVAKNANTSVKAFLIKHLSLEDKFYSIQNIPRYKHNQELYEKYATKYDVVAFLPNYTRFKKILVDIKCCVVREPIKRFKSTYTNRILFHKDRKFSGYSVNEILESLEASNYDNRHFLPQTYWLGDDLSYFTFYSFTDNIKNFAIKVNNFFGQEREFPRMNTGGSNNTLNLSNEQIKKIKKIYASDFELLKI